MQKYTMDSMADKLPEKVDDQMDLLNGIIKDALEKLIKEAKERNILNAPYGRPPDPTPLVTEEDLIRGGGFSLDPSDDIPLFSYDYGFNPLIYLADKIKWAHPDSVAKRKEANQQATKRLHFRAQHALRQLEVSKSLRQTFVKLNSGIAWGPFSGPLSSTSVLIVCRAIRDGDIIVQISEDSTFDQLVTEVVEGVVKTEAPVKLTVSNLQPSRKYFMRSCLRDKGYVPVEEVDEASAMVNAEDSSYDEEEEEKVLTPPVPVQTARFTGVEAKYFQYGEFYTLPTDEEPDLSLDTGNNTASQSALSRNGSSDSLFVDVEPVTLFCCGVSSVEHPARKKKDGDLAVEKSYDELISYCIPTAEDFYAVEAGNKNLVMSCLLGDLFASSTLAAANVYGYSGSHMTSGAGLQERLNKMCSSDGLFGSASSIFNQTSWVMGWNDGSLGSRSGLKAEEVLYKQYTHDLRRHQRKYKPDKKSSASALSNKAAIPAPPTLVRPPMSSALDVLSQGIAGVNMITHNATAARFLYRSLMVGPTVELFILDCRDGYLGTQQAAWLKESLERSVATWKVVMSGIPCLVESTPPLSESEIISKQKKLNKAKLEKEMREAIERAKENGEHDDGLEIMPSTSESLSRAATLDDSPGISQSHSLDKQPSKEPELDFFGRPIVAAAPVAAAPLSKHAQRQADKEASKKEKRAKEDEEDDTTLLGYVLMHLKLSSDPQLAAVEAEAEEQEEASLEEDLNSQVNSQVSLDKLSDGLGLDSLEEVDDQDIEDEDMILDDASVEDNVKPPLNYERLGVESGIVIVSGGMDVPYAATFDPYQRRINKEYAPNALDKKDAVYGIEIGCGSLRPVLTPGVQGPVSGPVDMADASADMPYGFKPALTEVDTTLLFGSFVDEDGHIPFGAPITTIKPKQETEEISVVMEEEAEKVVSIHTGPSACNVRIMADGDLSIEMRDIVSHSIIYQLELTSLASSTILEHEASLAGQSELDGSLA